MPTADRLIEALKANHFEETMYPELVGCIEYFGNTAFKQVGVNMSFNIQNPLTQDYLNGWREVRLKQINKTTGDKIRDIVYQAQQDGQGVRQIASAIRDYMTDMPVWRSEMIARTEAVSSANGANMTAWELSGIVEGKEWLSVQDDVTRDTHRAMDGKTAKTGELFTLPNGEQALGPGMFTDPAETINCRCTLLPKLDEKAAPLDRVAVWRSFDADVMDWQRRLEKAAREAFARQAEDLARVLDG